MKDFENDDFQFERGNLLNNFNRIINYSKVKSMLDSIEKQIEYLEQKLNLNEKDNLKKSSKYIKTPKEMLILFHEKNRLNMLYKQKQRLQNKLKIIEENIKLDIKYSDKLKDINN